MPLTDTQARKAQPRDKDYKLADSLGLYLFVTTKGAKSWRFKYRFPDGKDKKPKEKRLTFGLYPEVGLVEARDRRDAARRLLREHKDPAIEEQRRKVAAYAAHGATFEAVARDWHETNLSRWSPAYARKILQALERDIFDVIGRMPVSEVDESMVLRALRKIEARGSIETAKRVRDYVAGIFLFAIGEGKATRNPADVGKALKPLGPRLRMAALTEVDQLITLQKKIDESTATPVTRLCSRLLALTAVRPGVIVRAEWGEISGIDWSDPTAPAPDARWLIPAEKMKLELEQKGDEAFAHDVPLAPEAVAVVRALNRLTGRGLYLFPSKRSPRRPATTNALELLYRREGFGGRHVPHGWRASFSTIMNELAKREGRDGDREIIDMMLAHKPKGLSGSEFAYNRSRHTERRRRLAQMWATMITRGLWHPNELIDGRAPAYAST